MRAKVKKAVLVLLGWVFIVAGVAGLFLPFLQGILFLITGLAILSTQYLWARRILAITRKRYPATAQRVDELLESMRNWVLRIFHRQPGHGN